jgi:proline dehydrogenase
MKSMKTIRLRRFRATVENAFGKALAGRWIAGTRLRDAIAKAEELNARRESAIINYLGGDLTDRWDVAETVSSYQRLVREIAHTGVDASISVRMTQLGLRISRGLARRNYESIANLARRHGIFTWLEMEASDTVDATLSVYERQLKRKGSVGVCLQACMRRTEQDVRRLAEKGAVIMLVKGVCRGGGRLAFTKSKDINANYIRLMNYLFRNAGEFAIATHDREIVRQAMDLNRSYRRKVTYGMFGGVRDRYAEELAGVGNRVSIYVPFGRKWKRHVLGSNKKAPRASSGGRGRARKFPR